MTTISKFLDAITIIPYKFINVVEKIKIVLNNQIYCGNSKPVFGVEVSVVARCDYLQCIRVNYVVPAWLALVVTCLTIGSGVVVANWLFYSVML